MLPPFGRFPSSALFLRALRYATAYARYVSVSGKTVSDNETSRIIINECTQMYTNF